MQRRRAVQAAAGLALAVMVTGTTGAVGATGTSPTPVAGPEQATTSEPAGTTPNAPTAARPATVEELPTLGGEYSGAFAVNGRGQVAGSSETPEGVEHAVIWDDGEVIDLTPDLEAGRAGNWAEAWRVGDGGRVAGVRFESTTYPDTQWDVWTWQDGEYLNLTPEPRSWAYAADVDRRGRVLFNHQGHPFGDTAAGAVLWDSGNYMRAPLTAGATFHAGLMNERGLVAGYLSGDGTDTAAVWRPGREAPVEIGPEGWQDSRAREVNDRGEVLGGGTDAEGRERAFLWRPGEEAVDIGSLGGDNTFVPTYPRALAGPMLNERGDVVGTSETAGGERRPFLWHEGRMTDLSTVDGPTPTVAAMNRRGQVIGHGAAPDGRQRVWVWQDGGTTDLTALTGVDEDMTWLAADINDRGEATGYAFSPDAPPRVFLWTVPPRAGDSPPPPPEPPR